MKNGTTFTRPEERIGGSAKCSSGRRELCKLSAIRWSLTDGGVHRLWSLVGLDLVLMQVFAVVTVHLLTRGKSPISGDQSIIFFIFIFCFACVIGFKPISMPDYRFCWLREFGFG